MVKHLESYLGNIFRGWKTENSDIQGVLFKDQPIKGVSTYSTLGLSISILKLKNNKEVRLELIFSVYEKFESDTIASSLILFAEHVKNSGSAVLRGQVIGPGRPFVANTNLVGLYCSAPAFFEDNFHVYEDTTPPTVIVWLIPLLQDEIEFIHDNGWNKFEELLEVANCDFWNIHRKSVVG